MKLFYYYELGGTCMKKSIALFMTIILVLSLVAGCASKDTASESGQKTDNGPLKLRVMTILFGEPPVVTDSKAKADFEKRGNVQLDIEFVPSDTYDDKLSVVMTNLKEYDLILFEGIDQKLINFTRQQAFHDLTGMIKDKPNLGLIPQMTWEKTAIDGKNYAIPRPRSSFAAGNGTFLIRKDWLDKYNLPMPKTLDELKHTLKTFKEKDPAGSGKTAPLVSFANSSHMILNWTLPIYYSFGLNYVWKVEDGKAIHDVQTPEYLAYLDFLKEAWAEGLINKDAFIIKQQQATDLFKSGMGGVFASHVGNLDDSPGSLVDNLRKIDPNAKLAGIPVIKGPDGKGGVMHFAGFYGMWVIPKAVPAEKAEKIVQFLDWTASEENVKFEKAGITGIHSTSFENGIVKMNDSERAMYNKERPPLYVLENRYDKYQYRTPSASEEVLKEQAAIIDSYESVGIQNPFEGLFSETLLQNPDHMKKVNTVATKYMLGEATIDQVKQEIADWTEKYGNKAAAEYMAQYKK